MIYEGKNSFIENQRCILCPVRFNVNLKYDLTNEN